MDRLKRVSKLYWSLLAVAAILFIALAFYGGKRFEDWQQSDQYRKDFISAIKYNNERFGGTGRVSPTYGRSMLPTIEFGGWVVIDESYPFDRVSVGDIVIFQPNHGPEIVHRVVRRSNDFLTTQGDNNDKPDTYRVREEMYGGKVYVVPVDE